MSDHHCLNSCEVFLRPWSGQLSRAGLHPLIWLTLFLATFFIASTGTAQVPPQPDAQKADARVRPDAAENIQQRELQQIIRETEESLSARNWVQAAEKFDAAWQRICQGEDPLLTPTLTPTASEALQVVSGGRSQLEKLYLTAPANFRQEYQRQFVAASDPVFRDAVTSGDPDRIRGVAARWRFLPAGASAMRLLARISLERGEYLEATLQLQQLRRLDSAPSESLELQIALTAWRAGLAADAVSTVRELSMKAAGNVVNAGEVRLTIPAPDADLRIWLRESSGLESPGADQWSQPLGDFRRARLQQSGPVELQSGWTSDLFVVNDVLFEKQLNPVLTRTRDILKQFSTRSLADNSTVVPVWTPLLIDDLLIFRTASGVRAVRADNGELQWEIAHPDGRLRAMMQPGSNQESSGIRNPLFPGNRRVASEEAWEQQNLAVNSQTLAVELLFQMCRTNTAGQLSASASTLFVCEDSSWVTWSMDPDSVVTAGRRLPANYLRAYDPKTGVFRWEAGGQRAGGARVNLLAGYYFLGAPLILGSHVYVLAENNEGIFLLQIGEPLFQGPEPAAANPRILHSQLLAVPKFGLIEHPVRKHAGLIPSYAQGLIICPTCDEHIIAISAEDHSVRWVYRYNGIVRLPDLGHPEPVLAGALSPMHSRSVDLSSRWTDSLTRIVDNKIIITPRDSDQLYCLDLNSGAELFRIPRGLSRTVAAVTSDRLLLTGNKTVSAFSMEDGRLLWSHQIRDGQVSGTAAADGRIVHVPTTAPSILTLEIATGRQLLSRSAGLTESPGNLLSLNDQLFSQNLTDITRLGSATVPSDTPEWLAAQQMLLDGETSAAVEKLLALLDQSPDRTTVRELVIDVLLESLRTDFVSSSRFIPQLRTLIAETSVNQKQAAATLLFMLGMTPGDAAILPAQLDSLDRAGKQMDYLFELIVRGLAASENAPVDQLITSIEALLPEFPSSRNRISSSGFLSHRNSQLLITGIRRALTARTPDDQKTLQGAIAAKTADLLALSVSAQDAPDSQVGTVQLIRELDAAGLSLAASRLRESLENDPAIPVKTLLDEQLTSAALKNADPSAGEMLTALWDQWLSSEDHTSIQTMMDDLLSPDGTHPLARMKYHASEEVPLSEIIGQWREKHPDFGARPVLWQSSPQVTQSDDSSMWPAGQQRRRGPVSKLPLFGMPGLFRGWSFVQDAEHPGILAYDATGTHRWTFIPEPIVIPKQTGLVSEQYLLASGHMLAIKANDQLFMLDTSAATAESGPRLLWKVNLASLSRDDETSLMRQFVHGWERIPNFAPQPAGFFPCGPLTSRAIAVISGRRLVVFDSLTGERHWQLEGIPQDAVLLGTEENLLVLSESERQIEIRDLLDGELLSVAPVPEWWIDANENVGSSVRDIEVEPGMELLWRIAVVEDSCLLFRLSSVKSALEMRNVTTDQVQWSVELPQDSVFSNVDEDLVAVHSNEQQLRIFRIDTGREVASEQVTAAKAVHALYLRSAQDRLIVLPEAVEDPSLELNPVSGGMHVYGRMYAIDRQTMKLAWDEPLDHRHIRTYDATPGPILPNVPVMILLSRIEREGPNRGPARPTVYSVRIVDVKTGKDLFSEKNVGMTLNYHWMTIDAIKQQLQVGFDRFILTFDYLK